MCVSAQDRSGGEVEVGCVLLCCDVMREFFCLSSGLGSLNVIASRAVRVSK